MTEILQPVAAEAILAGAGLLLLLLDFTLRIGRAASLLVGLAGLGGAWIAALLAAGTDAPAFAGTFQTDNLAVAFKALILPAGGLVAMASANEEGLRRRLPEFLALLLWSVLGMCLLVSTWNLILLFLAFELVGVTSFVLTGFRTERVETAEAAFKYFLVGTFSSAVMLYGISLFYAVSGSTHLLQGAWPQDFPPPMRVAALLFLVGAGFKIAMVPFHQWAPEAYQGAPTPVSGFLSVVPKIAGFGVLLRTLYAATAGGLLNLSSAVAGLAAASMCLGNLVALRQTNVKRMLAYSSIAQVGYMLIVLVAADAFALVALWIYLAAYLAMNLGAFSMVVRIAHATGSEEISAFRGLAHRSLGSSLCMVLFLLGLAGIPPTAGFVGKFLVFGAAVKAGWAWLAVLGVVNSVVSLAYYFRLAHAMFFEEPEAAGPLPAAHGAAVAVAACAVLILALGLYPQPVLAMLQAAAGP